MKPEPRIEARKSAYGAPAMVISVFRDDQGRRVTEFVGTFESATRDNARDASIAGKAIAEFHGWPFIDVDG